MVPLWHPLRFLLVGLAGWINQQQRDIIDYLQEENRVLREQLGPRRLQHQNSAAAISWDRAAVMRHLLDPALAGLSTTSNTTYSIPSSPTSVRRPDEFGHVLGLVHPDLISVSARRPSVLAFAAKRIR